jgi:hypothetical protein
MNRYVAKRVTRISRLLLCLAGSILFSAYAAAQSSGTAPAPAEGPGPALFIIVVDPGVVTIGIEALLANYGVAPNSDYDTMRDAVSAAINSDIEKLEPSAGSKLVPNEEAGCRYEEGNESIFERDGKWVVVLDAEFECEQSPKLTHIHFNIFDLPGFTTATARIIDGDREVEVPLDGANRKLQVR